MAYLIMLDAGHGGQDPGAVYKGRQEKNDNLKLALAVGEILKNKGIDISYTRTGDVYQTPFEKAQLANQAGVDYFISFHRNSSPKENQYNGAEVLIYDKSGIKYQMAENILGALGEVGFREIGVKERPGLVVLRRTRMPALLIEIGFINSEEDNKLFDNKFSDIAQGIQMRFLEAWMRKQCRNRFITECRLERSEKKRMRTVCYISYWKKVIPLLCYMKTDCIKFRQVPISRLVMQ